MPAPGTVTSKKSSAHSTQIAKFDEIHRKHRENFEKRAQSYEDSDEENVEIDKNNISNLFKNYQGNDVDTVRITQFFESGDNVDCVICFRQVKSKDPIWSCSNCFSWYHLLCTQKWANDSICQKRIFHENQPSGYYTNSGVFVPKKDVPAVWDCPKCRKEYDEIPRHYECFCGRERQPLPKPFLVPHSCGEMCNRPLVGNSTTGSSAPCGHRCLLLCHPGPHPSCAQIIQTRCQCGKSPVKAIRCVTKAWNCSEVCSKTLPCGVHKCEATCHDDCPPCKKSRSMRCNCGSQTKEVKCVVESWSCQKVCKKKFPCGKHFCEQKCHAGDCGTCSFGLSQACFCGKKVVEVESCEDFTAESCGDTCLRPLACGNENHRCLLRCHPLDRGCGNCTEIVVKKCRCGNLTKEYQCSKELLCENKCKLQKNCKKHSCNRKCCVGCLPCDKICGKPLSCGRHKCSALCHDGNCYPCVVKQEIRCRCGKTQKTVLCGCAKKAKPPKCKEACKFPSKCHHEAAAHKCHFGDCPSCVQACGEILNCGHGCLGKCHDYVKVVTKDKNFVPKMPGEEPAERVEMKRLHHPPCETKIPVVCLGGHETAMVSCHEAKVLSCGRPCGRKLDCGNHFCKITCHPVKTVDGLQQDENCEDCESPCTIERPSGCTHPCPRESCHQGSCKRCHAQVKAKCFCGLTDVAYRCCDVHKRNLDEHEMDFLKQKFLSCGSRCIKMYDCGHSCAAICHPGSCPRSEDCKEKIKLVCACKTRKMDFTCDIVKAKNLTGIECDELCLQKKKLAEEQKLLEIAKKAEMEAEKNRLELERFEKKFGKKKYRERKTKVNEEIKDNSALIMVSVSGLIVFLALILYVTVF